MPTKEDEALAEAGYQIRDVCATCLHYRRRGKGPIPVGHCTQIPVEGYRLGPRPALVTSIGWCPQHERAEETLLPAYGPYLEDRDG